jgi:hypothetical protein
MFGNKIVRKILFVSLFLLSSTSFGQVVNLNCVGSNGRNFSIEFKEDKDNKQTGLITIGNRMNEGHFTPTNIMWDEEINNSTFHSVLNRYTGSLTVFTKSNVNNRTGEFTYQCTKQSKKF